MGNKDQGRENSKTIRAIAEGILAGRFFTSRHLWVLVSGNDIEYLDLMKKVFHPDLVTEQLKTLNDLLVKDLFNGTLFYGDVTKSTIPFDMKDVSPTHLPHFKDIDFIFGDNLNKLDEELKLLYKENMN